MERHRIDAALLNLRNRTYASFVELGRAPSARELGDETDVKVGWRQRSAGGNCTTRTRSFSTRQLTRSEWRTRSPQSRRAFIERLAAPIRVSQK
jgi:hypothetical protein